MKASRRVEYGLLALKWMAHKSQNELTTAREICQRFHAPFDPLARVLQLLHKHGVLDAVHGVQGGYRLKTDLSDLSFARFSEMILGKTPFIDCLSECNCDLLQNCNIVHPMTLLNDKLEKFLHTITVAELLQSHYKLYPIQQERLKEKAAGGGNK